MSRTLDAGLVATLDDPLIIPVLFVSLAFDEGVLYVHTDLGDIAFGGNTYLGVGDLGSIEGIEERDDGSPTGIMLRLSGVDTTLLNEALIYNYFERAVTIYLGVRDIATGAMVTTPFELFVGRMDQMRILTGTSTTSVIEIAVESEMIEMERSLMRYFSDTELQRNYSGDLGFRYLTDMVNARITVGAKDLVSFANPTKSDTLV
jgi:hypothetical protein